MILPRAPRSRRLPIAAVLAVVLGSLPVTSLAQTAFSESFDDSAAGGDLLGQAGGTGFSGPWIASGFNATVHDNYDVASGSLAFQDPPAPGNHVQSAPTGAIAGLGRNLEVPIAAADKTTRYFGLLLRPDAPLGQGVFNGFFGAYLDGTGDADLFVGKPGSAAAGSYVLENRGGSGQVQSGVTPVVGQTVLLVVRADLRPGPDSFTLYVNPDPCQPEPATGIVKNDLDLGDVTAVVIYSSGGFSLDELRMGSTFEEVMTCPVSEPFEYAAVGGDLLGQAGGSGLTGPWLASGFNATIHDNYDIGAGSLAFQGLHTTGNRVQSAPTNAIAGIGRNLTTPILAGVTTTRYFSFLVRPDAALGQGIFNGFFGAYLDGTDDADLFVGKPGADAVNRYVIEHRGGEGQAASNVAPVVGQTALLVVRAELRPGADTFVLYVNPDPCRPESEAEGVAKDDLDVGDVTAVVIYSTGGFSLDEIRLGSSFEAVVGLGGLDCTPPPDCNENGVDDAIDIANGISQDRNSNGVPDECEPPIGGGQIPSDCNQDGTLDLSDGICLLGFLFLGSPSVLPCGDGSAGEPGNLSLLDANGDGALDLSDPLSVFGYLFLGQGPPVLGTECTLMEGCPSVLACQG